CVRCQRRAEPQQEFRAEQGEMQGSWGAWGTWSTCSRTCGRGVQEQSRPCLPVYSPSISFCTGEHAHYRICNSNACPPSSKHIRAVQCSSYNNRPFMGRLYEWEPFNEVPVDQHCELNCRAVGFRFYVQQSERVIDGTPCGQNDTSLCVGGKCSSPGCDHYLGSGKVMDKCGVCGGDNGTGPRSLPLPPSSTAFPSLEEGA
uniref:Thrombospondin type 1 domain containing 4 n=1 Tax=Cyclopterus lumpus TaxID=8103 RepID=A0A8C2WBV6_CYCLU